VSNYLSLYLSRSGVCSRRAAADVIKAGRVSVNGSIVIDPAYRVTDADVVRCDNAVITLQEMIYVLFNKPQGVVTTCADDRNRVTVIDLVRVKKGIRLYPVGRLDKETTGALLLTNDGEVAHRLAHPKYHVEKIYVAKLNKPLTHEKYEQLKRGVFLRDGKFVPDRVFYPKRGNKYVVGLSIHSGRYRIIRRVFFQLGFEVLDLDRVAYGALSIKGMAPGKWRLLKKREIASLLALSQKK